MSKLLSTYIKEDSGARAEVMQSDNGTYSIHYHDSSGRLLRQEDFQGKSIHFVEAAAENWVNGIKTLNG